MTGDETLRPATASDAEAILFVHVAAIIEHGPSAYTDRQVATWAAKTEGTRRYRGTVPDSSTELVVAEEDEGVVGFGELDTAGGKIEAIFVDPAAGGNGIGSAILAHFETRLRESGFDAARLRAVLNAVTFYEERDYERDKRVTTTTTNGVEVESVWIEKSL